jgi:hypothetical protein
MIDFEDGRSTIWMVEKSWLHESHRSLRDGSCLRIYQAFHAWLPSFNPYGTTDRSDTCPQSRHYPATRIQGPGRACDEAYDL